MIIIVNQQQNKRTALTRTIHDRMPVLIEPKDFASYLSGETGTELLRVVPDDRLHLWPV
jgi:putative SOS response-associated peptidase YedK